MIKKCLNTKGKVSLLIILLLVPPFILYPSPLLAQTASPSGSLLQKLDELKKEIASKAAEIKNEIDKKVQNKAIVGTILRVHSGYITVTSLEITKTVKYDEFTEVIGTKGKKVNITSLEEGDDIAALGDFDDKNNLAAKRIVYLQNLSSDSGELVWGQILKAQGSIITLKNKSGNPEYIITSGQTVFTLGNNDSSLTDAKVEKYMVASGVRNKDGSLRARFVYFIPSVGFVKPSSKTATTSSATKH